MTADELSRKRAEKSDAIDQHRRELEVAVRELKVAGRGVLTPRSHIERHPYHWLLGSFALGLWIGWR